MAAAVIKAPDNGPHDGRSSASSHPEGAISMRAVRLALAVAGAAAFLASAAPASAAPREGVTIPCQHVEAEGSNVFGEDCGNSQVGPLGTFMMVQPGTNATWQCQSGWAEGNFWVRGEGCTPLPAGGTD
jgi:hypothetical protein